MEKSNWIREKILKRVQRTDAVIPVVRYPENNFFFYEDGRIMDILQIEAKDLQNISDMDLQYDFLKHWKFHKINGKDGKYIALNFPCDTVEQQKYFRHKLEVTKNPYQRKWLQTALRELVWLRENRTKREYYLMFFSENENEHKEFILRNLQVMNSGKEQLLKEISFEKKCQILHKMANQNMMVFEAGGSET